ncbi:glycoside hydrolase [Streptomyces sp. RB6PN25]|uniref:Glycoside hydrolase n=1 Tax=Streptomyces humicola TaxID=2953240 RepID=A0ABT1PQU5_9ACTN|nr:glycoside hydrolase family 38 C-terminal domain-containing protein [Streptomyces humicola]MCQ4080041.1 glycoside hydrolase [Streptomyces humicola]
MQIRAIYATDLFTGTAAAPRQVVRIRVAGPAGGPVSVRLEGPAVSTPEPAVLPGLGDGEEREAEVGVVLAAPVQEGSFRRVTALADSTGATAALDGRIEAAVPGWTMWMVSHFHYDPVWWNTQAAFTQSWYDVPVAEERRHKTAVLTAFDLVRAHLDAARKDPDYKFVLAELDYLKPHWDACPEDREDLRRFLHEGRVELVGGNYNEPSTNLTHPESTVRNAVHGIGYQRDVVGGDPRTAWMLDVFGHDPSYPGLMADAGLTASSWARGPFHMWGPRGHVRDNTRMQFPSEFEWISPSGRGLLTSYMANHYSAGWALDNHAKTLEQAMEQAYEQYAQLKPVAATRNVMLPVGGDHVIPSRWSTHVHRAWADRYLWPRFIVGLPREYLDAVRTEQGGRPFSPQTRDMNPVYTGKDVSYIDTKQAQRAAEVAVLDAERLAALATLTGGRYPDEALDKAWRQLAFGAHHDAVTGSESDQVYLDLLGGWREAYELGDAVRTAAADRLAALIDTGDTPGRPVLAVNTLSWPRDGLATVTVRYPQPGPRGAAVHDHTGTPLPAVTEAVRRHPDGTVAELTLGFLARGVPALGHRLYRIVDAPGLPDAWCEREGCRAQNAAFRIEADPGRGGALTSIRDLRAGRELLRNGALGAEFTLQGEYATHPRWGEGPWHLLPKGPGIGSGSSRGRVRAEASPIGSRLVTAARIGDLTITQVASCLDGLERIEFSAHVDGSIGQDHLLRVRFGLDLPGAKPVHEVGFAAIGRSFGFPGSDAGEELWTLDNPAHTWAGLSATVRIALRRPDGDTQEHAVGVAEVVEPDDETRRDDVRALLAALAGQGVTATCTRPGGPRYGALDLDSNLPDLRVVLGSPDTNGYAAELLDAAGPAYAKVLADTGRVFVPAARPQRETWVPGADVTGTRDLPALVVAGIAALAADLDDSVIDVGQAELPGTTEPYGGHGVALLNRGTPSHVAETDGTFHLSLMRSCTAWPSGVWLDGERRTAPDGSGFQLQHWSHTFEYALVAGEGDWREGRFVRAGQEYNHALLVRPVPERDGAASPAQASLPPVAGLASVEPDTVLLTALKARGNPLASAHTREPADGAGLTARLYESAGRATTARIRLFTGVQAAHRTDLLEQDDRDALVVRDATAELPLHAAEVATLALHPSATGTATDAAGSTVPLGPCTEPAQPVFTRYWLHNKGPAPLGYLPVSVHLTPVASAHAVLPEPGSATRLRLTVATSTRPAAGRIELDVPEGLTVQAPTLDYDLAPGEHAAFTLTVRVSGTFGTPAPGVPLFVAARIRDEYGQTLEDALPVLAGPIPGETQIQPLSVGLDTGPLRLEPGRSAPVEVRLRGLAGSEVRGEAQLLSPYGTWGGRADLTVEPWTQGFAVGPGEAYVLRWTATAAPTARPGSRLWALVRVAAFGSLHYTRPVPMEIVPQDDADG